CEDCLSWGRVRIRDNTGNGGSPLCEANATLLDGSPSAQTRSRCCTPHGKNDPEVRRSEGRGESALPPGHSCLPQPEEQHRCWPHPRCRAASDATRLSARVLRPSRRDKIELGPFPRGFLDGNRGCVRNRAMLHHIFVGSGGLWLCNTSPDNCAGPTPGLCSTLRALGRGDRRIDRKSKAASAPPVDYGAAFRPVDR